MSSSRWWLSLIFSIIILKNPSFSIVTAQITQTYNCINNGNYKNNSRYGKNLNTLFQSLPSNVDSNGFLNATAGKNQDRVNAIVLCRGDVQLSTCRSCVRNATLELRRLCPNQIQSVLWNEYCMVRYSNESIFGVQSTLPTSSFWSPYNVLSPDVVMDQLMSLMGELRHEAADGGALRKVAAGERRGFNFQTIYGMAQCTPDLSPEDCGSCLLQTALDLPLCCYGSLGGGINRPSCTFRYEVWLFYNQTMLPPDPTASPPADAGSAENNHDHGDARRTVITVVVSIAGFLMLSVCVCIFLKIRKKLMNKRKGKNENEIVDISSVESLQYDFETIREATNDFSDDNKLGQGGFGTVYWGKLSNCKQIAVKRLSKNSTQGEIEFKNEVVLVARLQHRNLVSLLGFCIQEDERILIYEFVANESLDNYIFDTIRRQSLDSEARLKIIGGIARGLLYLHQDSLLRIIHRDLKASNVLLDEDMNSKISDFGMATLFAQEDQTHGSTSRIVGTYGYMPPEYAIHGHFSIKSDVFSFGVLVLEIVTGQKNNSFRDGQHIMHLPSYAWRNWREGRGADMIDPVLRDSSGSASDMLRCIHIGLLCVQENAADRPSMCTVVMMLINSSSITMPLPSQPAFFMPDSLELNESSRTLHSVSDNEASITEMYPR